MKIRPVTVEFFHADGTDIKKLFAILRSRLRSVCSVSDLTENTLYLGYVRKDQPGREFAVMRALSCLSGLIKFGAVIDKF